MKYYVSLSGDGIATATIEIEADSSEEAKSKALSIETYEIEWDVEFHQDPLVVSVSRKKKVSA